MESDRLEDKKQEENQGTNREDSTPIDSAQMARLYEIGGNSLIVKMIQLFEDHSPQRICEMQDFEKAGDWDGVFRTIHQLKSSAGNFGAHSLFRLCVDIEEKIHHKQTHDLSTRLRSLETELNRVRSALMQEKARISG
ncbi:MAG: Hpt domain-containing protein [Candidatus Hinthialibacter sp.]